MADDNNPLDAGTGTTIPEERGISSVTTEKTGGLDGETRKKLLVLAGITFLGIAAYAQWPSGEVPEEPETQQTFTRIRSSGGFQPADLPDPAPAVLPASVQSEPVKPLGPIEQARAEEELRPATPSEADLIYESSKRAPLLAYSGPRGTAAANADAAAGSPGGLFGSAADGAGGDLSGFASSLLTGAPMPAKATRLDNPHLTITQGTMIPCALDTAMDSSNPGMVRCTVTDDIFSTTGAVVLLERGTRIIGEYQGGLKRGNRRLFVVWTRAETPNGVTVSLASPATDALGRSGFDGDVDTRFWTRFGGTMMLSIIDDALAIAANRHDEDGEYESTSNGASRLAEIELENTINVQVILRKNQGEEVAVMVARDLDFSSVYKLR
ncbi:type IV secretion system protein VirB10 [Leisingera caerulea]|uniref:type IV secretion system protein VirB10 n=1 Tax=Leisingera caerulea TaxID=506591 RepID=UPI0021A4D4AF|nr:type IV secretion system protein VirB10 [Leisingera caerulea]UWQ86016.1 type IV secretion system protein VirB10 [Leisingera caerulea]